MAAGLQPLIDNKSGDKDDLAKAFALSMRNGRLDIDSCLPAIVVAYNRTTNRATVKPLIMKVGVDQTKLSRKPIADVPVLALGGGGFFINFPLAVGDLGWIYASDRDISLFKQSLTEQYPPGGTLHSFENAMFIPDVFRKYTINGSDAASMVISTTDGTTRISIKPGEIDITGAKVVVTASTEIDFNTPLAKFSTDVQVLGKLTVTGTTNVNGGFTSTSGQPCTLPTTTTIGGITVTSHGHTSSSPGTRTSGGMIT